MESLRFFIYFIFPSALVSAQLLTERSTTDISWVVNAAGEKD